MIRNMSAIILIGILLINCFTGCSGDSQQTSSETSQTSSQVEQLQEEESIRPYSYTFQPHVLSQEYKKAYGEEFEKVFYEFCDAVLEGKDSFPCPDELTYYRILDITPTCLPIADYYLEPLENQPEDGVGRLEYSLEREEYLKEVERYKQTISDWITTYIQEGDGDFEKVISLYTGFSQSVEYDHEAFETEHWPHMGSYRTLMEKKGICQEFSGAFSYLLLQAGINSVGCASINRDYNMAHDWNMIQLNGKNFYFDTTFQNTVNPDGLEFFGMDESRRDEAGDFDPENYNIGNINLYGVTDFPAKDQSFAPLWQATCYELDREKEVVWYYTEGNTQQKKSFSYAAWN